MTKDELKKEAEVYLIQHGYGDENRIDERIDIYLAGTEPREKRIEVLEQEIRCECSRCVYSDSPCIRSDYGVEKEEDVCPNYENVFVAYSQLKKENAELKNKLKPENCLKLLAKEGYIKFTGDQLTKAKEIIKELIENFGADYRAKGKAEQFLKEVEK